MVSNLAARVRAEATISRARSRTTEALYGFSRKLAGCGTLDDVLWATAYQIALMLRLRVCRALTAIRELTDANAMRGDCLPM